MCKSKVISYVLILFVVTLYYPVNAQISEAEKQEIRKKEINFSVISASTIEQNRIANISQWDNMFANRQYLSKIVKILAKDPTTLSNEQKEALKITSNLWDKETSERERAKNLKKKILTGSHWSLLFKELQLDVNEYNEAKIASNLSVINNHSTLQYLSSVYYEKMKDLNNVTKAIKERNYRLIQERLSIFEHENFVNYKSHTAKRQVIKDIDFHMDNDAFMLGRFNQDRDYTGGGALTISTDYFEAKWINLDWILNLFRENKKHSEMLSYQSISIGMNFYTPYIRFRNNYELANVLFQYDRPFGSYVHFNRDKYRLYPKGLVRHHGSLQFGVIGTKLGRDIQAMLHRDAIVSSQKVYGWHKQIANRGRWLVQYNNELDLMLYSTTNSFRSIFKPYKKNETNRFKDIGLNIIGSGEAMVGGFLTAVGGGIGFSTSDFTAQSGQNTIRIFGWENTSDFGFSFETNVKYRYVIHNSMLEGFGYFSTYIDDIYDDDYLSAHTLNSSWYKIQNEQLDLSSIKPKKWSYEKTPAEYDQLNRHLWLIDFKLSIRCRKMTIYYQLTYNTKEFEAPDIDYNELEYMVKPEDRNYYNQIAIKELEKYNSSKYYGYAKIGISWILDY